MARLKQQLKESEVDREELSAELRECRKIKVEPGVSGTEDCECTNVPYVTVTMAYWPFRRTQLL